MGEESKVICTFESDTDGQCWVVDTGGKVVDYVSGDFSAAAGKASASGQTRVFAGRRSDPFFFNLGGFIRARTAVETACGGGTPGDCPGALPKNAAGCPSLPAANVAPVRDMLDEPPPAMVGPCAANQIDCFANANVMAIVVQVDKSLIVNDTKQLLGVWGSTHAGQ
jgi:hypothetical protein